ncbi:MAG: LysR family transcriptional regulator [Rhodobiaceae bacterium]|nr:LysR family transcriptional regulator [Rhodobiaceae bacterium]
MDTRKLTHFVEVVDQGSISKAAERLRISQPALTKSLRVLETELDVKLLERSSTGVTVTEFGRSLYAHARAVAAEIEHAHAEIRRLSGGEKGYLRIGVLPSVSSTLLSRAVASLAMREPDLSIYVSEAPHYELMLALRRREFDFVIAMTDRFDSDEGLRQRIILRDQLRIIARAGHPLDGKDPVTCADLVGFPWIHPVVGGAHRPILGQLFKDSGIEPPQAQIECASVQFAKSVMANSDTLGLMPLHTIEPELRANTLCCLSIIADDLQRTIGIYYSAHRPLNPAARLVMREIERVCSGLPQGNWRPGPAAQGTVAGRF